MAEFDAKDFFNKLQMDEEFFVRLTEVVKRGKNTLSQMRYAESMVVDSSWILQLENYIFSIENIVKKPKSFIKDEGIVVPVEKAKKTTSETVRHLSQHSNFVRSVEADGTVVPIKVLTKEIDEDFAIYENRFVNTLIIRLLQFIEQRYVIIQKQIDAYDTTTLNMTSDFDLERTSVSYSLNLSVKNRAKANLSYQANLDLLHKLENIRKRVLIIKSSEFCKRLAGTKPILPPIMKTNILKMDVDYKNCYNLWLYISSYTAVGFSVDVAEKSMPVDNDYFDDLSVLVAASLKTMIDNNSVRNLEYRKIKFKKLPSKRFKVQRHPEVKISYENADLTDDDSLINQYYYEKIKSMIAKRDQKSTAAEITNRRTITQHFKKFYKDLNTFTNLMYEDALKVTKFDDVDVSDLTSYKKAQLAYKKQSELYSRYQLLTKLKLADLDAMLKKESEQLVKLEKLKFNLEQKKKPKKGGAKRKVSQVSLENLRIKKNDMLESATFREVQMLSDERTRQAELMRAKEDKAFENRRKRKKQEAIKKTLSDLENFGDSEVYGEQ